MNAQEQDIWDNMTVHCDDYYRLKKRIIMFTHGKRVKRTLLDGLEKMVNSSYEDENITEDERNYLINYIND